MTRRTFLRLVVAGAWAWPLAACSTAAPRALALSGLSSVPAGSTPEQWVIPDNARAEQYRQQYPLSCEVACFRMVLFHYDMDGPDEQLMQALGNNPNPNLGFRGDYQASDTNGFENYGAHAPAVKRLVDSFPSPGTFNGILLSGLDDARAALAHKWLVIAWIPVGLTTSSSQPVMLTNGETVNLVPNEHTILLHGYDSDGVWIYDPEPDPHLPPQVDAQALADGMSLFDNPGLAIQRIS